MRCSMTGRPILNMGDAIYDDGEWISWEWINGQLHDQELAQEYPRANMEVVRIFEELVNLAMEYREITGRYLQIWGELGELYAEIKFGVERHRPGAPGSDGRMGNDWVEVKTISPEKEGNKIQVKRAGNFNKLLIVKIDENFEFQDRMIDRRELKKGSGKYARHTWEEDSESV